MDIAERYARALKVDLLWLLRGDTLGPSLSERIAKDIAEAMRQAKASPRQTHPFVTALQNVARKIEAGELPRLDPVARVLLTAAREVAEIRDDPSASPHRTPPANDLEDARALAVATVGDGATGVPAARSVQMIEMQAAAGGGAYNLAEAPVAGPVWFRRDWIDSHGIDPTQAVIISVRGDSMEPTLPAGCKILVDRHRRWRHVGHIYVVTTPDGLIVKRMGKGDGGGWVLVSDNDSPDWPDEPWPNDAVVAGEVKWMAREFP